MAWDKTVPTSTTNICASTEQLTSNYNAMESWSGKEHSAVSATTPGGHIAGKVSFVALMSCADLAHIYTTPPTGSFAIATDLNEYRECMVCCASADEGTWANYTQSHLFLTDLACGHPHPQYLLTSAGCGVPSNLSSAVTAGTLTFTGTTYVYKNMTVSGAIHLSGSPTASNELITKAWMASGWKDDTESPRWVPSATSQYIGWDSGVFFLPYYQIGMMSANHGMGKMPDIVLLYLYQDKFSESPMVHLGMNAGDWTPQIVRFNTTRVEIGARYPRTHIIDDNAAEHYSRGGKARIICINHPSDYTTGWQALNTASAELSAQHGLAAAPDFYTFELADGSDGTGYHGYAMIPRISEDSGSRAGSIYYVSTDYIKAYSPGGSYIASFYNIDKTKQLPTYASSWYYRIQAWSWTPDYTSDWKAISTANNVLEFEHNLGVIPYLYLVEFGTASDGTGDIVPIMGSSYHSTLTYYTGGACFASEKWFVFMNSRTYCAVYRNPSGAQAPTSGYIRIKAWCT